MFWLCVLFGTAAILSLFWEVSRAYPTAALIWAHVKSMKSFEFFLWSSPFLVGAWGWVWVTVVYHNRLQNYYEFSTGSPGPRVRLTLLPLRDVTLEPIEGEPAAQTENATNAEMHRELRERQPYWRTLAYTCFVAASILTVAIGYRITCAN